MKLLQQTPARAPTPPAPAARHVVVTVHGIRTFGLWQERLERLLRHREPDVVVYHYKYGFFSVLAFLIPWLRWLVTRRFRRELQAQLAGRQGAARVDIVAHSFGTHLVGWALLGIPPERRPAVHTIILAGSVLKASFPWGDLIRAGTVRRVVNECGLRDGVLVANQLLVLGTGMAGLIGFAGMMGPCLMNRYHPFGHSGYFKDSGGHFSDAFMEREWVGPLTTDEPPPPRPVPAAAWGVRFFLLQNAEPLKLALYLAPFIGLTLLFWSLSREARSQRDAAHAALAAERDARAEQAGAYREWGASVSKISSKADALRLQQKSLALCRELVESHPHDPQFMAALADTHTEVGRLQGQLGMPEAAGSFRKARELFEELARADPGNVAFRAGVIEAHRSVGFLHALKGESRAALGSYEKALSLQRELAREKPNSPRALREGVLVYEALGKLFMSKGSREKALHWFTAAAALLEPVVRKHPERKKERYSLALEYGLMATQQEKDGPRLALLQKGKEIVKRLADEAPTNLDYQCDLSCFLNHIGDLQVDAGRLGEARLSLEEALAVRRCLLVLDPHNQRFRLLLAVSCNDLALLYDRKKELHKALDLYREARTRAEQLGREGPGDTDSQLVLARVFGNIGGVLADLGRPGDSLRSYEQARAVWERLAATYPNNLDHRSMLGAVWHDFGLALGKLGRRGEAAKAFQESVRQHRRVVARAPNSPLYRRRLDSSHQSLRRLEARPGGLAAQTAKPNPYQGDRP
jgi:tetratricopeptide (TPR) repeat protein